MITIGLIDDHELFRSSLKMFINTIGKYSVVLDEDNGMDFFKKLDRLTTPLDLLITDFQMPVIDGKEVIKTVSQKYPTTKIVILSLFKHDHLINETIQAGANGFLTKGIKSSDLKLALEEILLGNIVVYNNSIQIITKSNTIKTSTNKIRNTRVGLSKRQLEFLRLCVNPVLTYKEIASQLKISPKTADRYRDDLFKKLGVKSRSGLVLYAIETGLYPLN